MGRLFTRLYAGLAVCGLLIAVLSFLPWVKFESVEIAGDTSPKASIDLAGIHTSRWRDLEELDRDTPQEDGWCSCRVGFGDGWLTAGLGLLLVAIAAGGWYIEHDRAASVAGGLVALGVLSIAGFDAIADWQAIIYTNIQGLEAAEGSVQAPLIVLLLTAAVAAVLAGLALGFAWLYDDPTYEDEEDEMYEDETIDTTPGDAQPWA
jgi:hypothetical protein